MDGFGFLEAFRRLDLPHKDNVRIIIVTSSANPDDMNRAMKLGAMQYLTKPLQEDMLRLALQTG